MYRLWFIVLLFFNVFAQDILLTNKEKQWLKKHPTITLGTDYNWSPYIIKNQDGILSGYDIDILKLINKNTGANFKIVTGKWKDILSQAQNRQLDGLSTSAVHKERMKYYNFSTPYVSTQRLLVVSNNNSKNINSLDDLDGKIIGYQEKNLFDKKLASKYKNSTLVPLKNLDEILKQLILGKIDVTFGSHALIYLANKKKLPYLQIVDLIPNSKLDLVFSIRNDYPQALSIINKGLASISEDKKSELYNKWFFTKRKKASIFENELFLTKEETTYLNKVKSLKIANLKGFPPFSFYENETPKGYSIDYMKLLGKKLDKKIEFISKDSWNELLTMLKEKKLDIIPTIARVEQRKKFIDYATFNHVKYNTGIAKRKDFEIKSFDDLEEKIVAVMNNTILHKYLQKNFPKQSLLLTSSTHKAVLAVSSGQADIVIGSMPVLEYHIQKDWLSNMQTTKIEGFSLPSKIQLTMGVKKGDILLKSILEKANSNINLSEIIKLKQKWMNIETSSQKEILFTQEEKKYLNSKKQITMCIDPNWMPFEKYENGKHLGISADYINIIEKSLEKNIVLIETKDWLESLFFAKNRKCDILSLATPSIERKKYLELSKPYLSVPLVIATKINQPFINDVASIKNKSLGVVKGYSYGEFIKEKYLNMKIIEVDSIQEGLKQVQKGELFALIGTLPVIGHNIQKDFIGELKIAGKFKDIWDLGIAIRNDEPLLKSVINRVINTIDKKQQQEILNKWISINPDTNIDYDAAIKIGIVFLVILSLIIYRNISVERLNGKLKDANKEINEQQKMVDKYVLILSTDLNGVIIDVNSAYCDVTGYLKAELIGTKHELMRHPDITKEFFHQMWKTIQEDKIWIGEIKNFTKKRKILYFNVYIEPIFKENEKVGYRSISEDITDKKRIEKLSVTDKLTGLFNRLKLDEVLVLKVQAFKRYNTPFSVILLDVDDFKIVNDSCGHDIGDKVLQEVSILLKNNTRTVDTVGRWGGEEFVIICENTVLQNAYLLAEKLRRKINEYEFECVGNKTISLGVAQFQKKDNISTIFKTIDKALYDAKKNGKNQTVKAHN